MASSSSQLAPALEVTGGGLSFGHRTLWQGLDLTIERGEYFAVLGPNGSGKSTFIKVVLGLTQLSQGRISVLGAPATLGNPALGYIPQQRAIGTEMPLRARDFVGLGVDGHRWGFRLKTRAYRSKVDELLEAVGASDYAKVPVGLLSGGEQQRLRIAQALANDPKIILADEALLSLDLNHQYAVSELIHRCNRDHGATVIFVTHEINPIIDHVDRLLYLAGGRFTVGSVPQVMRTEVLTDLYQTSVSVIQTNGRYVVVGGEHGGDHHCAPDMGEPALSGAALLGSKGALTR
ncbi:metal ABC transporter ATP-binding protein [Rothia nasisuis]|uniref:metal ABC transporter ATP-binding protein n=1 Tax=Rothia nasisuis TaxID=2109647 RepID=UPI001F02D766|nr:ATP-binding cassette domain-containing protein [Rothia nasisuis]